VEDEHAAGSGGVEAFVPRQEADVLALEVPTMPIGSSSERPSRSRETTTRASPGRT
jgi:hypothetical protein